MGRVSGEVVRAFLPATVIFCVTMKYQAQGLLSVSVCVIGMFGDPTSNSYYTDVFVYYLRELCEMLLPICALTQLEAQQASDDVFQKRERRPPGVAVRCPK